MALSAQRVLQRAGKYTKTGQYALAAEEYQSLLARYPANARARAGLARLRTLTVPSVHPPEGDLLRIVKLLQQGQGKGLGQGQEADKAAQDLLARFPDTPDVIVLAGMAAMRCGRPAQAVGYYNRALKIQPDNADTHYNLGNALRKLGQFPAALEAYGAAISIQPDYLNAYINIGVTLSRSGQTQAAVTACEQAVALAPDDTASHESLGNAHYANQDFGEAVKSYRHASKLQPDNAELFLDLGNAYYSDNKSGPAIEALEKALALRPGFAAAMNTLAAAHQIMGAPDKAREMFEAVLRKEPENCVAHYNLSTLKTYHPGDAQIEVMRDLQASGDLSEENRAILGYAQFKVYKDLEDTDRSFQHLKEANYLKRRCVSYDLSRDNTHFNTIRRAFQAPVPALVPGENCAPLAGPVPIFILGMPRSGTTLVEQILCSHSDVHGAGELKFLGRAVKQFNWQNGPPDTEALQILRRYYLQAFDACARQDHGKPGDIAPFMTDKMPLNFRLVGFILAALPEARIIHTKRDARATCWSIFSHFFSETGNGNGFAWDQVELATYYRMYLSMMSFWNKAYPGRIYELSYETLTGDQANETRNLLDHVGLEWQAQCLEFQNTKRSVRTASNLQVRQKMYQGSSDKWRRYESHLGGMTEILADH